MRTTRYPFTGIYIVLSRVVGAILAGWGMVEIVAAVVNREVGFMLPVSFAAIFFGIVLLANSELLAMMRDLANNSFAWREAAQLASVPSQAAGDAAGPAEVIPADDAPPESKPAAAVSTSPPAMIPTRPVRWRVTAIDANGKLVAGTIRAVSADDARRKAEHTMREVLDVEPA